jgi:transcriptional regulator with XRE-family HTH domain
MAYTTGATISRIESDKQFPRKKTLKNIAKALSVSETYFYPSENVFRKSPSGAEENKKSLNNNNVRRFDDYVLKKDERYKKGKEYLYQIFNSRHEDVKKSIYFNLETFAGTVEERDSKKKKIS